MGLIWEELAPRLKDLLEQGKSGVVTFLLAASQRLQSHEHKVKSSTEKNLVPYFI